MSVTTTHHPNLVNGQIKFKKEHFTVLQLTDLAAELKSQYGDKLKPLAIRSCSKSDMAIVFALELDEVVGAFNDFVYKITDQLKRRFGNSLSGWDITHGCWVIE